MDGEVRRFRLYDDADEVATAFERYACSRRRSSTIAAN